MLESPRLMTSDLAHMAMTVCHLHLTCTSSLLDHLHKQDPADLQTVYVLPLYCTYYLVPFPEEHSLVGDEDPHSPPHYPQKEFPSLHHCPPLMRADPEIPVIDAYLPYEPLVPA